MKITMGENKQWLSTYTYDNRNYLQKANFGKYDCFSGSRSITVDDLVNLTYDANGNIKFLNRYATDNTHFDDFEYLYENGNNQLSSLDDRSAATGYNDLEYDVHLFAYDKKGQMTRRTNSEGRVEDYEYDVYGKVTAMYYNDLLKAEYLYDNKGFRTKKLFWDDSGILSETWYVRDASGNLLSTYYRENSVLPEDITQIELPIYGSGRIGINNRIDEVLTYIIKHNLQIVNLVNT